MRNCPLCNVNNSNTYMPATKWNNRHKIELRKCKDCKFVFSKESSYDYSCFSTCANQSQNELTGTIKKQGLNYLMDEIIKKAQINTGKVLDYGCGIGMSLMCLQQKGFSTFGIEQSNLFLERHKELNITSAKSFPELTTEKDSFDLIIMKDVLEHVNDPVQTLNEVVSYVKPGGYLYIRVPNVYHYDFHWSIDTKSHVNHFSPNHLFKLFEQNSMKRIDFINLYDISTTAGKLYNFVFWKLRNVVPMYHQISVLYQKSK